MNDQHKDFNIGDLTMIRKTYVTEILYKPMLDKVFVVTGFKERNQNDFSYDHTKRIKTYLKLSIPCLTKHIYVNPKYIIKI